MTTISPDAIAALLPLGILFAVLLLSGGGLIWARHRDKQALAAWLDQEEKRNRLTREALTDVDAGRVIDHQAVQTWADSLSTDTPLPGPR